MGTSYSFDHVPVNPNRERTEPITNGIGVGTIRSNLSDLKLKEGEWCVMFGHKYRVQGGETVCVNCWKLRSEIESGL